MTKARTGEAALWTVPVRDALRLLDGGWLPDNERARADALRQPADRKRYMAARLLLRHALTEAAGGEVAPAAWRFVQGENGKPKVAPVLPGLEFSVSHTGGCVAVAICGGGQVGIDVESAEPDPRLAIVEDALTQRERTLLAALPDESRWETFLRLWTLKEACAKALGLGAALDFARLEVSLAPPHVAVPPDLVGPGRAFHVETETALFGSGRYILAAAAVAGAGEAVRFRRTSLNFS